MTRPEATSRPGAVLLRVIDVPIAVEVTGEGAGTLRAAVLHAWRRCLTDDDGPGAPEARVRVHLAGDRADYAEHSAAGAVVGLASEPFAAERLLEALTMQLTFRAIEARAGRYLMFHACAVSAPGSPATVVLVGPSGRGKTTAARELASVFGYVTDETAALADGGRGVVRYPKPLSVKPGDGEEAALAGFKRQVSPDDLGLRTPAPGGLTLAAVVLLDRRADAPAVPLVEPIPLAEAIGELIPEISALPALPAALRQLAETLERTGGARRISYREASALAPVVAALVREAAGAETGERSWSVPADLPWAAATPSAPGAVRRAAHSDAIEADGELLVLSGHKVVRLAGLGPLIWRGCAGWTAPGEIRDRLAEVFGGHPEADDITRGAIESLVGEGLLERRDAPAAPAAP